MLLNHLFYTLKPLIPRRIQIAVRRRVAGYKRRKYSHIWPIDPEAGKAPQGWKGWPANKKFALVLSHDVDTAEGYKKVLKLAELEERMGFRSCFNFVPERYGRVSLDLLDQLRRRGFDVAVHGLKHDGKLFLSRRHFDRQATRINQYLEEWKTEGFTSPSMHRNLDWMTALNIKYSTSTFDTDPFEPQPDGVGTIFPFLVYRNGGQQSAVSNQRSSSYELSAMSYELPSSSPLSPSPSKLLNFFVELPYTLPQDSTLFIILQETTIDIWKRKLDWIVEEGGMALLNTHPDYMDFGGMGRDGLSYPVRRYIDFLGYLQRRYSGQYFHSRPMEIAHEWGQKINLTTSSQSLASAGDKGVSRSLDGAGGPARSRLQSGAPMKQEKASRSIEKRGHILFIVENNTVPPDIRVWREAKTAKKAGYKVSIIAPVNEKFQRKYEVIEGIEIYRHQTCEHEGGMRGQVLEYLNAFLWETYLSVRVFIRKPFQILHAANPPDNIFLIGLLFKILGVKFVFDHHDLSPELYLSKFSGFRKSAFGLLRLFEKLSCSAADIVISTNESFRRHVLEIHKVRAEKVFVVRNDPEIDFLPRVKDEKAQQKGNEIKLLYVGAINAQDGCDLLIEIINILITHLNRKEIKCTVIGDGDSLKKVKELVNQMGLQRYVDFTGYIYDRALVSQYMSEADICLETAPYNEANRRSTFIKIMEYMACGKPIVAFDLDETRASVGNTAILIQPGDLEGFAGAIDSLISDAASRQTLGTMARARIFERLNWHHSANTLKSIYKSMFERIEEHTPCKEWAQHN